MTDLAEQEPVRTDGLLDVAHAAGHMATSTEQTGDIDRFAGLTFEFRLREFMDTTTPMPADEQLRTVGEFWGEMDLKMPELTSEQLAQLRVRAEAFPDRRLLPTPLLCSVDARKWFVERVNSTKALGLDNNRPLHLPGQNIPNARMDDRFVSTMRQPAEEKVQYAGAMYGMRYLDPTAANQILTLPEFIDKLVTSGKAVQEDGRTWVFPFVDMRPQIPPVGSKLPHKEGFRQVEPTLTADTLLLLNVLHQLNHTQPATTPDDMSHAEFANEALLRYPRRGGAPELVEVALIGFTHNSPSDVKGSDDLVSRLAYFGRKSDESPSNVASGFTISVRPASSGLGQ